MYPGKGWFPRWQIQNCRHHDSTPECYAIFRNLTMIKRKTEKIAKGTHIWWETNQNVRYPNVQNWSKFTLKWNARFNLAIGWAANKENKTRKIFQLWINLCRNVHWRLHTELENRYMQSDTTGTGNSVCIIAEVEFMWNVVSFAPSQLPVLGRCPQYKSVHKERLRP